MTRKTRKTLSGRRWNVRRLEREPLRGTEHGTSPLTSIVAQQVRLDDETWQWRRS
jgi:hypothetical protein